MTSSIHIFQMNSCDKHFTYSCIRTCSSTTIWIMFIPLFFLFMFCLSWLNTYPY